MDGYTRADVFERNVGRNHTDAVEWLPAFLEIPMRARLSCSHVVGDAIVARHNADAFRIARVLTPTPSLRDPDRASR
jgi:hypothetical protein